MTKIDITSQQEFTGPGTAGVLMFLAGPVLSAIAWGEMTGVTNGSLTGYWLTVWLGAFACQCGIVFMLVGRKYDHQVTVHPADQALSKLGERQSGVEPHALPSLL
ncbi:hypothetical protein [Mesorhizobium hawassense]|uniref:hypothetical protein n=1 Tax=Mesorhizobium hawassense TaxID=1209954 RepID=UPI0011BF29C3|nr:hypothetical protein [Mesorhizobium hawassense]